MTIRPPPPPPPRQGLFDLATFAHAGLGVGMGAAGVGLGSAGAIMIYLNFVAQDLGAEAPGLFGGTRPDTWQNSLADAVVELVGYYVGRGFYEKRAGI